MIQCEGKPDRAARVIRQLIAGKTSIHADPFWRAQNRVVINPVCLAPADAGTVGKALREALNRVS